MSKKVIYFPNLDAIRFFAFIVVFVSHLFFFNISFKEGLFASVEKAFFHNGDLGVSLFFVLSGFLITFLLLQEKQDRGRIDIKNFYMRRVLRIWPLYFLNILIGVLIIPLFVNHPAINLLGHKDLLSLDNIDLTWYFTFLGNFDFGSMAGDRNIFIGILWSVCVEEQFYLVRPLVISFFWGGRGRRLNIVLAGMIMLATAYRIFIARSYGEIHYYTFSCISDLAMGAFGANLIKTGTSFKSFITELKKYQILLIYISLIALLFIRKVRFDYIPANTVLQGVFPVFFSLIFMLIILEQNYSKNSIFKLGRLKHLSEFGRYTYFAYCFHYHVLLMVVLAMYFLAGNQIQTPGTLIILAEIVLSYIGVFLLGKFSFSYIEKPFIRLKSRFAYIIRPEEKKVDSNEELPVLQK